MGRTRSNPAEDRRRAACRLEGERSIPVVPELLLKDEKSAIAHHDRASATPASLREIKLTSYGPRGGAKHAVGARLAQPFGVRDLGLLEAAFSRADRRFCPPYREARNSFQGVANSVSVEEWALDRIIIAALSTSFGSVASTTSTTSKRPSVAKLSFHLTPGHCCLISFATVSAKPFRSLGSLIASGAM
jgi:hypothetical protein